MKTRYYSVIGLMSGTSLDGLDICHATFQKDNEQWVYEIKSTQHIPFPETLLDKLNVATNMGALEFSKLNVQLGLWFGGCVNSFIEERNIDRSSIHFIASHGQTIFHQPEIKLTVQIGCGNALNEVTGIPVINDFRTADVMAGGQGAPLVPIGDYHLFSKQAQAFLNIGGFANMTYMDNNKIFAFDVCPANIVLNKFAQHFGKSYDVNGILAASGEVDEHLLSSLNNIDEYHIKQPTSLGTEWVEKHIDPILAKFEIESILPTFTEHIAIQIAHRLNDNNITSVLITGGGTKNIYLIDQIKKHYTGKVIIPNEELIDFKEALIFGFLGVLHQEREPNCVPNVTGASKAVIGGVLHNSNSTKKRTQ